MRIQVVVLASLLAAAAAHAQSAPSPTRASDSWDAPAHSSTVSYRDATTLPGEHEQPSHFKFKPRRATPQLPGNAAQEHSGKAAIMGVMGRDGRPAVSCPQTPMDPACH